MSWAIIESADLFTQQFGPPDRLFPLALVLLVVGILAVVALALVSEGATQRPSVSALLLLGLAAACAPATRPADTPTSALAPTDTSAAAPGNTLTTTSTATSGDSTDLGQLVASGLEVYRQQYCGLCHRFDAVDTGGLFGPTHNGIGTTADQRIRDPKYTGTATTAEGYIRESIIDPDIYIVPGYELTRYRMPAYTNLSEADLNALVHTLLQEK